MRHTDLERHLGKHAIELTDEERHLLSRIHLQDFKLGDPPDTTDGADILALLKSLSARKAIPQSRLNYWNEPSYQRGRMKGSHKELFERNGCRGADIYQHGHFLKFLRYFLFGADLPEAAVLAFEERVGNPDWISSSDIVPLGKYAVSLTRTHRLDKHDAGEQFFKLAIDLGLDLYTAQSVGHSVTRSSLTKASR